MSIPFHLIKLTKRESTLRHPTDRNRITKQLDGLIVTLEYAKEKDVVTSEEEEKVKKYVSHLSENSEKFHIVSETTEEQPDSNGPTDLERKYEEAKELVARLTKAVEELREEKERISNELNLLKEAINMSEKAQQAKEMREVKS